MNDDGDAPQTHPPAEGTIESAFALVLVYALLAPGLAALIYEAMAPTIHLNELVLFFYFLGTPMTLAVSLVHWLLRRWSSLSSIGVVIAVGALLAGIGGPEAAFAAAIAYALLFPLAQWLFRKLAHPPLPSPPE